MAWGSWLSAPGVPKHPGVFSTERGLCQPPSPGARLDACFSPTSLQPLPMLAESPLSYLPNRQGLYGFSTYLVGLEPHSFPRWMFILNTGQSL